MLKAEFRDVITAAIASLIAQLQSKDKGVASGATFALVKLSENSEWHLTTTATSLTCAQSNFVLPWGLPFRH